MFGIGIGAINFKNSFENALWIGFGVILGSFITYKVQSSTMSDTMDQTMSRMIPTIQKAIDKETIKNEIKNEIELNIDKIKKSDSINININQIPDNKQEPINVIVKKKDSIPKKKKSFLGRLIKKVF